jgi:hypothetical protein
MGHTTDLYNQSKEHIKGIRSATALKDTTKPVETPSASSNDIVGQIERLAGMFEKRAVDG